MCMNFYLFLVYKFHFKSYSINRCESQSKWINIKLKIQFNFFLIYAYVYVCSMIINNFYHS